MTDKERIVKLEEELTTVKITLAELYANILTLKDTFIVEWNYKLPDLRGEASSLFSTVSADKFEDVITNLEIGNYPTVMIIRNNMAAAKEASDQP